MEITSQGVPVSVLVDSIKKSLKTAGISRNSGVGDLKVASIQLNLRVVATESAGGRFDLRVPFIGMKLAMGAKVTRQDTHSIDITLVPLDADQQLRETRGDIETALVDAITTIRGVMASAAEGDEPWTLSTSDVEITFVVTKEGTISIGAEGEFSDEVTNKLRLSLGPS